MSRSPNINGANQYTPDPREQKCWDLYVKSLTAGVPNALQAAIKAGYSKTFAKQITVTRWFLVKSEALRRTKMLSKAERNLDELLDMKPVIETKINDKVVEQKTCPELVRVKADVSKFTAARLGKKDWSERVEQTGADGEKLLFQPLIYGGEGDSNTK